MLNEEEFKDDIDEGIAKKEKRTIKKTISEFKKQNTDKLIYGGDLSKYGNEFQIKLLSLLIKDREFSFSILPIVKSEYFSDIYLRKVFVMIEQYMQTYNSCPVIDNLAIMLQDRNERMLIYNPILKKIQDVELDDRDFVIDNSRKFCFSKYALLELEEMKKELIEGNFSQAKKISLEAFKFSGLESRKIYDLKKDYTKIFQDDVLHRPVPLPFPTFNNNSKGGPGAGNLVIFVAASNFGKCFAMGTHILMYDGSIKNVEDIKIGDKLLGPDGKSRTVTSLAQGEEEMYEIQQDRGINYTVNKSHILCLKNCEHKNKKFGEKVTIEVSDYLNKNDHWKKIYRGYKPQTPLQFEHYTDKDLFLESFQKMDEIVDPYFLGLWLGDGNSGNAKIINVDKEVISYLHEYANKINHDIRSVDVKKPSDAPNWLITYYTGNRKGPRYITSLAGRLKKLDVINNKHIPKRYLLNTYENRMQLLAGLLDSDGYLEKVTHTCFEITQKNIELGKQIEFLARSLGFQVKTKTCDAYCYNPADGSDKKNCEPAITIRITGETYKIPTKIKRKQAYIRKKKIDLLSTSKIKVVPKGIGKYYGFTLDDSDSDKMFLLEDFTVVHNTACLTACARHANALQKNAVFFSYEIGGVDILRRYIAGVMNVAQEELKYEKEKIEKRIVDSTLGNFRLIETRATQATVEGMRNDLEWLKSTGFFPDVIYVDSLNQLKTNFKTRDNNEKFEYLSEELRDLSNDYGIPAVSCYQSNRSGFSSKILTIDSIGKAIEPFQVADMLITFGQDNEMFMQQKCTAVLLKNRLGPRNIALECFYDSNMGVFKELKQINEILLLNDKQRQDTKNTIKELREKLNVGEFLKR